MAARNLKKKQMLVRDLGKIHRVIRGQYGGLRVIPGARPSLGTLQERRQLRPEVAKRLESGGSVVDTSRELYAQAEGGEKHRKKNK